MYVWMHVKARCQRQMFFSITLPVYVLIWFIIYFVWGSLSEPRAHWLSSRNSPVSASSVPRLQPIPVFLASYMATRDPKSGPCVFVTNTSPPKTLCSPWAVSLWEENVGQKMDWLHIPCALVLRVLLWPLYPSRQSRPTIQKRGSIVIRTVHSLDRFCMLPSISQLICRGVGLNHDWLTSALPNPWTF